MIDFLAIEDTEGRVITFVLSDFFYVSWQIVTTVLLMGLILMIVFPFECPSNNQRLVEDDCDDYQLLEHQLFHGIPLPIIDSKFSVSIGNKINCKTPVDTSKMILHIMSSESNKLNRVEDKSEKIKRRRILRKSSIDEINSLDNSSSGPSLSLMLGTGEFYQSKNIDNVSEDDTLNSSIVSDWKKYNFEGNLIDIESTSPDSADGNFSTMIDSDGKMEFESVDDDDDDSERVILNLSKVTESHEQSIIGSIKKKDDEKSSFTPESLSTSGIPVANRNPQAPRAHQMLERKIERIEVMMSVIDPDAASTTTNNNNNTENHDTESEEVELLVSILPADTT